MCIGKSSIKSQANKLSVIYYKREAIVSHTRFDGEHIPHSYSNLKLKWKYISIYMLFI